MIEIECVVDSKSLLGEATYWDAKAQVLWWIDIWGPTIHRYDPADHKDDTWTAPEYLGTLSVRERGGLVVSLVSGFYFFDPATGEVISFGPHAPRGAKLFKYRTRYYLRRRAWRYFRWLGYRDPAAYVPAIVKALAAFEDADLQRGENILDSWALMHACFGEHDAARTRFTGQDAPARFRAPRGGQLQSPLSRRS